MFRRRRFEGLWPTLLPRGGALDGTSGVSIEAAIEEYREALRKSGPSKNLKFRFNLAMLLDGRRGRSAAVEKTEQAEAVALFRQVAESNSKNLPASARRRSWLAVGAAAERSGDVVEAETCYRSALSFDERDSFDDKNGGMELLSSADVGDFAVAFERLSIIVLKQVHAKERSADDVISLCRTSLARMIGCDITKDGPPWEKVDGDIQNPVNNEWRDPAAVYSPLVLYYWGAGLRRKGAQEGELSLASTSMPSDDVTSLGLLDLMPQSVGGSGGASLSISRETGAAWTAPSGRVRSGKSRLRESANMYAKSADAARWVYDDTLRRRQLLAPEERGMIPDELLRRRLMDWARYSNFAGVASMDAGDFYASEIHFRVASTLLSGCNNLDNSTVIGSLQTEGSPATTRAQEAMKDNLSWLDNHKDRTDMDTLLADVWANHGISLKQQGDGRLQEAMAALEKSIELSNGENGHALVQLASLRTNSGAASEMPRGAGRDGEKIGLAVRKSLPRDYVAGLFDNYSDEFEKELVNKLQYIGPDMLEDAVCKAEKMSRRAEKEAEGGGGGGESGMSLSYVCVDVGCGTGLCGRRFRKRANVLIGVDLSPRMIELTLRRAPELYDAAVVEDAVEFFSAKDKGERENIKLCEEGSESPEARRLRTLCDACRQDESVDLVVAGDVFNYIGDLSPLLQELARVLKPRGMVAYTAEDLDPWTRNGLKRINGLFGDDAAKIGEEEGLKSDGTEDSSNAGLHPVVNAAEVPAVDCIRLLPCGRFGHSEAYVRESAAAAGLQAVVVDRYPALRWQRGKPVSGLAVVLRKPEGARTAAA